MVFIHPPGQSHNHTPGIGIPVGCPQSGEGRHHIAAVGGVHLVGHILRIPGRLQKAQLVPKPLDGRPGHKHRAFQGVVHLPIQTPGDGGHQAVLRVHGGSACIHQEERSGTIGAFALSRLEAGLAKEGCLLVSRCPGDGNGGSQNSRVCMSVNGAGGHRLRQHGFGNVQEPENFLIPGEGMDIEQHGPGGVGVVRHMDLAPGELPDEPGLHRSKEQLSGTGLLPGARYMVQNPPQLGSGEIGVQHQAGFLPEEILIAQLFQLLAMVCRPAALPHDGRTHRPSGEPVPHNGGFPLIGNADGRHISGGNSPVAQGHSGHLYLGGINLLRVMLHPARLRKILGKFLLGHCHNFPILAKKNTPVAGGTGVQSHDILAHRDSSCLVSAAAVFDSTIISHRKRIHKNKLFVKNDLQKPVTPREAPHTFFKLALRPQAPSVLGLRPKPPPSRREVLCAGTQFL